MNQCRHCRRRPANRPRRLCWNCYYAPGVRDRYPSAAQHASKQLATANVEPPPPEEPTAAQPGTPAKVTVLEQRVAAKRGLWHPDDR